jgi:Zn-dependent protease with chaperone function
MTSLTALAQGFAERLPACLLGGTVLVLFALLLLRLLGQRPAGARFVIWFSTLLGIASLLVGGTRVGAGWERAFPLPAHAPIALPASRALYIFCAWAVLAGVALLRVVAGLWQLHTIRKTCTPLDLDQLDKRSRTILRGAGWPRRLSVCVSDRVGTPAAIGFLRPAIVLPSWLVTESSPAELHQVVLHEVAHLRRWDDWTNLAQKVLRALLFFHPLAWWIERRLSLEREMACDDLVVRKTNDPKAYARCLAWLAEKSCARRGIALVQTAVHRLRHTSLRVSRILRSGGLAPAPRWKSAVSVAATLSFAAVLSLYYAPAFFVFDDGLAPLAADSSVLAPVAGGSSAVPELAAASPRMQTAQAELASATESVAPSQPRPSGLRLGGSTGLQPGESEGAGRAALAAAYLPRTADPRGLVVYARYVLPAAPALPAVVVAKTPVSGPGQTAATGQATLIIVESEQSAGQGSTYCLVTVWRLIVTPGYSPVRKQLIPKTT